MIVIAIIAILAAVALPNLRDARKAANEADAIGTLRAIHSAQTLYRDQDTDGNGTLDYARLMTDLCDNGLLDDSLRNLMGYEPYNIVKAGYGYAFVGYNDAAKSSQFKWSCRAEPVGYQWNDSDNWTTGTRRFFINVDGVIRYTVQGFVGSSDARMWWPTLGK